MTVSFPSWSKASFAASSEPSASPSGFSCVVRRNCSWPRIVSATATRSLAVVWGELIDQLRHANPPLNRRIVLEGKLRGPFHPELSRKPTLQNRVRRLKTFERLPLLALRAEHRDEDARCPEIRSRLDTGDGDESNPRVLQ